MGIWLSTSFFETDAKGGRPGESVDYTLHVANLGNTSDTYEFSVTGNTWAVEFSVLSVTLGVGESDDVVVSITVPVNAVSGSSDIAVIHVTSQGSSVVSAQSTLTTTVTAFEFFLPVINRQ